MTTNDPELPQRKIYEKIRLYTQYGINDPNNPSEDEKKKLTKHFETLLRQYTDDRTDHTSPTYSAFLEKDQVNTQTATTDLIDTRVDSNKITESAVDLALPIVFFETGSASSKLNNWSQFIGPKLILKGNNLWDYADNIAKSKNPTEFALRRVGERAKDFFKPDTFNENEKFQNIINLDLVKLLKFLRVKEGEFVESIVKKYVPIVKNYLQKNDTNYAQALNYRALLLTAKSELFTTEEKKVIEKLFPNVRNDFKNLFAEPQF